MYIKYHMGVGIIDADGIVFNYVNIYIYIFIFIFMWWLELPGCNKCCREAILASRQFNFFAYHVELLVHVAQAFEHLCLRLLEN